MAALRETVGGGSGGGVRPAVIVTGERCACGVLWCGVVLCCVILCV